MKPLREMTLHEIDLLTAAIREREACAQLLELSNDQLRLIAGEMTAQEMRTVQAVLKGRAAAIRAREGATHDDH